MPSTSETLRSLRRRIKASLPYVRRREHRLLQRAFDELVEAADGGASPATTAELAVRKPFAPPQGGEVCLFVSFADQPVLKAHVHHHIQRLVDAGIRVLLIVNTELPAENIQIDAELLERTSGAWIRRNLGFDFGAWAHALQACGDTSGWSRLYLVNDSIVGPLDDAALTRLIGRVRASAADLVGLTEALAPRRHLQSYFLVLQQRALRSAAMQGLFARMRNWPTKSQVIALYETRLTRIAEADGLRCEALFPNLGAGTDDTSLRWAELVESGFPFIKSRVIAQHGDDARLRAWLAASSLGAVPR